MLGQICPPPRPWRNYGSPVQLGLRMLRSSSVLEPFAFKYVYEIYLEETGLVAALWMPRVCGASSCFARPTLDRCFTSKDLISLKFWTISYLWYPSKVILHLHCPPPCAVASSPPGSYCSVSSRRPENLNWKSFLYTKVGQEWDNCMKIYVTT